MSKYYRLVLASVFFVAGFVFFSGGAANATGTDQHQPATQNSAPQSAYEYATPKGCSLSLLARRSLQLYDQSSDTISLSEAQIIFAETNIVRSIGARLLEVNELVKIDKSLVEDFAKKSQDLSATKIAAWQKYAKRANFKLDDINPTSALATSSSQSGDASQDKTNEAGDGAKAGEKDGKKQATPWYWWVIGGSTLGIIYYLLSAPKVPTKK